MVDFWDNIGFISYNCFLQYESLWVSEDDPDGEKKYAKSSRRMYVTGCKKLTGHHLKKKLLEYSSISLPTSKIILEQHSWHLFYFFGWKFLTIWLPLRYLYRSENQHERLYTFLEVGTWSLWANGLHDHPFEFIRHPLQSREENVKQSSSVSCTQNLPLLICMFHEVWFLFGPLSSFLSVFLKLCPAWLAFSVLSWSP